MEEFELIPRGAASETKEIEGVSVTTGGSGRYLRIVFGMDVRERFGVVAGTHLLALAGRGGSLGDLKLVQSPPKRDAYVVRKPPNAQSPQIMVNAFRFGLLTPRTPISPRYTISGEEMIIDLRELLTDYSARVLTRTDSPDTFTSE